MEKLIGEGSPTRGHVVLVLKLAHMTQFREKTMGNGRVMHTDLCNDDVKGE